MWTGLKRRWFGNNAACRVWRFASCCPTLDLIGTQLPQRLETINQCNVNGEQGIMHQQRTMVAPEYYVICSRVLWNPETKQKSLFRGQGSHGSLLGSQQTASFKSYSKGCSSDLTIRSCQLTSSY